MWGLDRYRIKALAKMLTSNKLSEGDYQKTLHVLKRKVEIFSLGAIKRGKAQEVVEFQQVLNKFELSQ